MISVVRGQKCIALEFFSFPGGERHVRVEPNRESTLSSSFLTIHAQLISPSDVLDLLLLNDAIVREYPGVYRRLELPYLPYARQDRVAVKGEPLSVKVFCDLINSCNFDRVTVWDVHSNVSKALLNPRTTRFVEQDELVMRTLPGGASTFEYLVAPDTGAASKTKISSEKTGIPYLQAYKSRDLTTGKLSSPKLMGGVDLSGKRVLIVDDIADGGYTFIQLGNHLREVYHADSVYLYIPHGIFSKGLEVFEGVLKGIYCPNVINQEVAKSFINDYYKVQNV